MLYVSVSVFALSVQCYLRFRSFSGVLTVNVSVLLLSLASPDESSLVSHPVFLFRTEALPLANRDCI